MRILTRCELTAALAARQMLLARRRLAPAKAIRLLTPLQGQDPPAPYIALAARLEGFAREDLQAAVDSRTVLKSTLMRTTLHITSASEYPCYAQLARQTRLRAWRRRHSQHEAELLDELRAWLTEPRSNEEIRERVGAYPGVDAENPLSAVAFARTLLPLIQLPPAGHWSNRSRPRFVVDQRPLPEPAKAAAHVLRRYLAAFGPASRRDAAAWAGVAQSDLATAWTAMELVTFHDEHGVELLDLPDQPLPPASTKLPVRMLARWDQALLAYADRERIIPPEVKPLGLTLSGAQTMTVGGRVAASWRLQRGHRTIQAQIEPHVEIPRSAHEEIRAEAGRVARFAAPELDHVEVAGL